MDPGRGWQNVPPNTPAPQQDGWQTVPQNAPVTNQPRDGWQTVPQNAPTHNPSGGGWQTVPQNVPVNIPPQGGWQTVPQNAPANYPPQGGWQTVPQNAPENYPPRDGWMTIPQNVPANVPPGLEYLTMVDQLLVKQQVELLEVLTGFETENKYEVLNSMGQKIYYAAEQSDCCSRNCCGNIRSFQMKIVDNYMNTIIQLDRPMACQSCCFPCCLQKMEVFAPPGTLAGYIEQNWSICTPSFSIKNAVGDTVLRIEGPLCTTSCCGSDVEFKVLSKDSSSVVGSIRKQWTGFVHEAFTDADNFGITFPMDLDVRMKAVMLGACFLIDFMYFEDSQNDRHNRY